MSEQMHGNAQQTPTPLLSICIPTYNRARFLRVMLQALLPQVQECAEQVEVWVLDNASNAETQQVLDESRKLGRFEVYRQTINVGPTRNIVQGPAELARGRYSWVLGDHNLLRPNALRKVLQFIEGHSSFDAIYVNFRCATFPTHWPETANSGYDGNFAYLGNYELTSERVEKWTDLLRPQSAACTQNYVHIAKTSIWRSYWQGRSTGPDYTNALTTYPHTVTLLHSVGHLPAAVITEPAITIFNGAQSWGNPETRLRVYLLGFTDFLRQLRAYDLPKLQIKELRETFFKLQATRVVHNAYSSLGRKKTLTLVLLFALKNWQVLLILAATLPEGFAPATCRGVKAAWNSLTDYHRWYVYNFRPARWLRSRWCPRYTNKNSRNDAKTETTRKTHADMKTLAER